VHALTLYAGVFARNLQILQKASPEARYATFLENNANSIWTNDRVGSELSLVGMLSIGCHRFLLILRPRSGRVHSSTQRMPLRKARQVLRSTPRIINQLTTYSAGNGCHSRRVGHILSFVRGLEKAPTKSGMKLCDLSQISRIYGAI